MKKFIIFILLISSSCTEKKQEALSPEKIELLKKELSHRNRYAKIDAAEEIAKLGSVAFETIPGLIENVTNEDPMVRSYSILALGQMGDKIPPNISLFTKLLEDENDSVCQRAAWLLTQKIGQNGEEAFISFLKEKVKLLEDKENSNNRLMTARLYGRLGKYGELSVSVLGERLLYDPHPSVRQEAAISLGKIGSQEAVPFLQQALRLVTPDKILDLKIEGSVLFTLKKIPFEVYALQAGGNFPLVISEKSTIQEIEKLKNKPYINHLYTLKKFIFYKNNFNAYIPLFTDTHKPKRWVDQIFIKHSHSETYMEVPIDPLAILNRIRI